MGDRNGKFFIMDVDELAFAPTLVPLRVMLSNKSYHKQSLGISQLKKYMSERIYKASERPSVSQTYPDLNLKSLGKARMLQKHRMNVLLRTKSNGRSLKPRK